MPTPPSSGRPRSWTGWSHESTHSLEEVSLQDLEPAESAGSFAGLLPERHRDEEGSSSNSNQQNHQQESNVYKGVKNLFFGSDNNNNNNRRKSDEAGGSDSGGLSIFQRPRFNRSVSSEVGGGSNNGGNRSSVGGGSSNGGEGGHDDVVTNPLEASLMDGQNLNVIKQGLNEALGSDGKGTWLATETGSLFSKQESHSGEPVSPNASNTDLAPTHTVNAEYRRSHHSTSDHSRMENVSLAEEGMSPEGASSSGAGGGQLSPTRDLSPARQLSSLVRHFSSRVVSGNEKSPPPGASPRTSHHQPRTSDLAPSHHGRSSYHSTEYNRGRYDDGIENQAEKEGEEEEEFDVHGDEDYIDPQHSVFALDQSTFSDTSALSDIDHEEATAPPSWRPHLPHQPSSQQAPPPPPESHYIEPQLCGKSLFIFDKDSKFRRNLYQFLHEIWVEPLLLLLILLQTIVLSYIMSPDIHEVVKKQDNLPYLNWGSTWSDWVILALFIVYTLEALGKIVAYGLWDDSQLVSEEPTFGDWKNNSFFNLFKRDKNKFTTKKQAPVVLRTLTTFVSPESNRSRVPVERAYLRSSWNRVDFISVVSYWIYLLLSINNFENEHKFYPFRVLAHLRILRLLNLTHGTSAVLRSIKKAAPLLKNIAIFIGFFWILFAIIGVQSFKSSLRRTCVWVDKYGVAENYTSEQFCGSFLNNVTLEVEPYVFTDGAKGRQAKGYTCPANSICVSDKNPQEDTVSFDNIFNSLEMVFVVMSQNTFSDMMYNITDTDYLVAALFFIAGVLVLNFWLVNLLVAVIVSSFRLVREELQRDEFSLTDRLLFLRWNPNREDHLKYLLRNKWGRLYHRFSFLWILVIAADIIVQCTLTDKSTREDRDFIYHWQIWTTSALCFEIIARFCFYLPYWRAFFYSKSNCMDLFLNVANIIILLPFVHDQEIVYSWLTIFQLMRFYRVAIAIPFVRRLWKKVLGSYKTIWNLTIFLFILTFLCSILAALLLRGVVPYKDDDDETQDYSFFDLANSFVAMYVVASTENWTEVLYSAVESGSSKFTSACIGAFLILWFIISSFIVINLFIAIITENLGVSPEVKRKEQIRMFVKEYQTKLNKSNYPAGGFGLVKGIFKKKKKGNGGNPESGDSVFDMLLERHVVDEFLSDDEDENIEQQDDPVKIDVARWVKKQFRRVKGLYSKKDPENNPFLDRNEIVEGSHSHPANLAKDFINSQNEQQKRRREFLEENPDYDVALWVFKPESKFRRFCQKIVAASHGIRHSGVNPNPIIWYSFSIFMLAATIALVCIACINTPLYYKNYSDEHGLTAANWITFTDAVFVGLFSAEAVMKIVADGFYFTPNAYARSSWNKIDLFVLISLWINLISEAFFNGYVSRFVRCFEALRALRLLSISQRAQQTFHDVILVGLGKIMGASLISLCLLFPYSVWGLNIFNGRLYQCTDDDVSGLSACINEYASTPFNWDVTSPRAIVKPYYDYDTFGNSFLVSFCIISLEGWTDVLNSLMSITDKEHNPENFASRYNGIFSISYHILSTIFILTLFVSVIIKNYSETRGTAFLTDEQLAWYEIKKILNLVRPSRRPPHREPGTFRHYLLTKVQNKTSWIYKTEKILLGCLTILLCIEYYPETGNMDTVRNALVLVVMFVLTGVFLSKLYCLGFKLFLKRRWEVFGLFVSLCGFVFTLFALIGSWRDTFYNFQKLSLVGTLLLWIPRSSRLDQLFKTGTASFPVIGNLLITWFVLYLAYAIAFNQVFGLTRIGPNGSENINFRSVPKALILLFRLSCGEGWNELMSDFVVSPPHCVQGTGFTDSDCGSSTYAYILFISWNIISMYIFANMFVSLIYENFSYVFQGQSSDISRYDIKLFKKAWLHFDPEGTGYIKPEDLYKFLRTTEGYFSMSIYHGKYSVKEVLKDSKAETEDIYHVDLIALNATLKNMSGVVYKQRRSIFEKFCTQAFMEAHPEKGISFNKLLLQFPLYKTMDENKCLKLDDYLKRKMLLQKVEVEMLKDKLRGFLQMVYWRKEYLRKQREGELDYGTLEKYNTGVLRGVLPKIDVTSMEHGDSNRSSNNDMDPFVGRTLPTLQPPAIITSPSRDSDYDGEECESPIRGRHYSSSSHEEDDGEVGASTSTSYNQHLTVKSTSPRRGNRRNSDSSFEEQYYDDRTD